MGAAWDWSPIARVGEAIGEDLAEIRAYGGGNRYENALLEQKNAIAKEDWPDHEYYREGMEWEDGLTPVAAKYRAEFYDARRSRDAILAKQTIAQKVVGVGVQMGVGLVDPVNYIPIIGPAYKAKAIASMGAIGGRMVVSGLEAGAGSIGANILIGPELKRRGEAITFEDYAWDTVMGTGVGMLFGGAGGAWAKHFRGETKGAVLRGLQKSVLDVGDGKPVDVGPIMKEAVEAGQFNRERAFKQLVDGGLDAVQSENFLTHWEGLAAAQGMDVDSWVRKHIADIEVGGSDGEGIRFAKKVMYDETGKIRVEYEDTGAEFSLQDRKSMKAYFDTLEPEKIKQLKFEDPNQYLDAIKDIVDHLFTEDVIFRPRKDWSGVEYEHFTKQSKREEYLHSLPNTFKNEDIKVVVSKADGEKLLYFKRYVDEELGKDVWDIVIAYNKRVVGKEEINTKIPTRARKGKSEWARFIDKEKEGVEPEAPQSTNPDGDTGNAPTRQDHKNNIGDAGENGKHLPKDIRRTVEDLQSRAQNAAPLKVVNTFAELPEHIREHYRSRKMTGGVRGVQDNGKVYIVADAIDSPEQAAAVWLHEQGVHHGLRGLVGDDAKFNTLMDSVFDHFGAENLEMVRQEYGLDFTNVTHRREAAEEMLAHIGEQVAKGAELSDLETSAWESIKAWFRDFLRNHGLEVEMTDEDVAWIVKDAVRWTMDGTPSVTRHGPQRFSVGGKANGAVQFLPDGRAHVRIFDGADLGQAGESLSSILAERFGVHPPQERLDWRVEKPERGTIDPIDTMEVEDALAQDMEDVQVLMEAGRVTEEEMLELKGAERGVEQANRISTAFQVAAECIVRGVA
ncbi:hypothetical protein [Pseudodesulfovibrio sediminis]|nr:hypothetical protein [Pseudodesulfovibrio sediminis]